MAKFTENEVKHKKTDTIVAGILAPIAAFIGEYLRMRIREDVLTYLPKEMDDAKIILSMTYPNPLWWLVPLAFFSIITAFSYYGYVKAKSGIERNRRNAR